MILEQKLYSGDGTVQYLRIHPCISAVEVVVVMKNLP